jgi:serine/threonine-protein kinase
LGSDEDAEMSELDQTLPLAADAVRRQVLELRGEFERAWEQALGGGEPPQVEDFLCRTPEPWRESMARDLDELDRDYRTRAPMSTTEFGPPATAEVPATVPATGVVSPPAGDATVGFDSLGGTGATVDMPKTRPVPAAGATVDMPRTQPVHTVDAGSDPGGGSAEIFVEDPPEPGRKPRRGAPEGPKVPGYEILGELGRGGMGVVYKARHQMLDRVVALKVVLAGSHASNDQLERFLNEARAVAHLRHPGIVQIFDVGETGGLPYFSLEFVEGGGLDRRIAGKPQDPRWSAGMVEELARAMQAAHQSGIIHRDLKPANILMLGEEPKITDFGLAKRLETDSRQTRSGTIMGTPNYMSPEQAWGRNSQIGPASDLYSLGAILYELLTGRPPFTGTTLLETLEQVRTQEPVPPTRLQPKVPIDLETIALKCLQKEPAKRYASAAALADDLGRFLGGEPILARPVSAPERLWRWCLRNPRVAALSAAVLLLLATIAATSTVMAFEINRQKDAAVTAADLEKRAREAAEKAEGRASLSAENERKARIVADNKTVEAQKAEARAVESARNEKAAKELAVAKADEARKGYDAAAFRGNLAILSLHTLIVKADQELKNRPGLAPLKAALVSIVADGLDKIYEKPADDEEMLFKDRVDAADQAKYYFYRVLAAAHQRAGWIYEIAGQNAKALQHHTANLRILEKLLKDNPDDPIALRNLAGQKSVIGGFYKDHPRDYATSLKYFREAMDLRQKWAALDPNNDGIKRDISINYGEFAENAMLRGDPEEARGYYLESQAWRKKIINFEIEQDPEFRREWAGTHDRLGEVSLLLGDVDTAEKEFRESLKIRQELAAKDPDTIIAASDLSISHTYLGHLALRARRDAAAARAAYDEAAKALERVWKLDRDDVRIQSALAQALYHRGVAAERLGDAEAARKDHERALELQEDLAARAEPDVGRDADLTIALARCGRRGKALERARTLVGQANDNAKLALDLAAAYALCSRSAGDQASSDRAAALKAIGRAIELGWKDRTTLETDPDLDPIRDAPEFAALLGKLGGKGPKPSS